MIIHIINNIPSPYRSILFGQMKKMESEYGHEISFYYLSRSESVRNWSDLTLSDSEFILPVLFQCRNKNTTTSDFIINYGYLKTLLKSDVSLFFGYSYFTYIVTAIIRKISNKKNILFCESTSIESSSSVLIKNIKKFLIKNLFYKYIVPGKESFDYLVSCGVKSSLISFAHNSSDLRPSNKCVILNKPKDSTVKILFVGRLSTEKNIDRIVVALLQTDINFQFNIVGTGPELDVLKTIIDRDSRFIFHGHLEGEKLIEQYESNEIIVLPSTSEPWGLVINEAINFGLAVMLSNKVGCRFELVNENGIIFDPYNAESFIEGLNYVIENLHAFRMQSLELSKKFTSANQAKSFLSNI